MNLNNFWAYIKSNLQTISGDWNFTGTLKIKGNDVLTELDDLSGVVSDINTLNTEVSTINGQITTINSNITTINTKVVAIPIGGSTGQVLTKSSGTNYATAWATPITPNYLGVFTTTDKNALTPSLGNTCFDSTLAKLCVYTGAAWETITSI